MPDQINHDNLGDEGFALETREGRLISDQKSREAERKAALENPIIKEKSFADRMKTHRFWLVRGVFYIFYSVWMVVMAIGMFIAWLIAMLFI